jgi:MFS family permease
LRIEQPDFQARRQPIFDTEYGGATRAPGKNLRVRPAIRRWLIVTALFVVTYGISTPLAAYGVFLPVLADEFGWSRGAISTALSLNLLLGGLAAFPIGALADRHGPRGMLVLTVSLAGAGFALVSTVGALWQLYLFVGVVGGVGMSSFFLLSASTVTRWFDGRRGLALALGLLGFNLAYISGGPLAAWLILKVGWRMAYALLGSGCGLMTMLAALSVRLPRAAETGALHRPASRTDGALGADTRGGSLAGTEAGATLREALADPRQWCLNLAWLLLGVLALMLSVHIVPFVRDHGISLAGASVALTAYGIGSGAGRLAAGAVSDWIGTRATMRAAYVIQVLALLTPVWVPSREMLLGSLVVLGVGFAASDTMVAKVIPDVFGVRAIGAILGVLTLGWRFGAALGPAVGGYLYDLTGSYTIPFGAAPLVVLVSWALFALGTARRRS